MKISRMLLNSIISHSRREEPNEACGILAGREGVVEKVYEMENADKSPQSFSMDGKEQLRLQKEMRAEGLGMIGIYHSHPVSEAFPSEQDVKLAFYPEVSYVILSLKDFEPNARAFRIVEGKIIEEMVETQGNNDK